MHHVRIQMALALISALFLACEGPISDNDGPSFGTVLGTVYSQFTQEPVSGAVVFASKSQVADTTDSLGAFFLDSLLTGLDTFMVAAAYHDRVDTVLNVVGGSQEVTFFLDVNAELGCIPVEDTGRVYLKPIYLDTLSIYPKALFARFYPTVTDTNQIKTLLEKHHLRTAAHGFEVMAQQLVAYLCITDESRAECHFTPYGKEGFDNFGADSLVEYAFGIFNWGYRIPCGTIWFSFAEGTPHTQIDSLFNANGLRLLYTRPDYPTGVQYATLVTPRAKKNVLDLGQELRGVPFAERVSIEITAGGYPVRCD